MSWFAAYHASAALAPWLNAATRYRVTRWPNFGLIRPLPSHIRVAAALASMPARPDEIAARANVSSEEAIRTLNALAAANVVLGVEAEVVPVKKARRTGRPAARWLYFIPAQHAQTPWVGDLTVSNEQELKIVFTGPMGAGKTTAIRSISDIPPVSTEVDNTDRAACDKDSTTVALDYGQLALEDGTAVRLYGTPGQERFSFMWEILCAGAIGVVLLIDGSTPTALEDLRSLRAGFPPHQSGSTFRHRSWPHEL